MILPNVAVNEENGIITVREDKIGEIFYGDVSDDDVEWAKHQLISQPLAPFVTPVSVSEGNFGRVRRIYIECIQDRAIGPATQ